jgi:hypothetical protein
LVPDIQSTVVTPQPGDVPARSVQWPYINIIYTIISSSARNKRLTGLGTQPGGMNKVYVIQPPTNEHEYGLLELTQQLTVRDGVFASQPRIDPTYLF